jgi:RNA polymerase sigma-70 factor (ECF subfamily)
MNAVLSPIRPSGCLVSGQSTKTHGEAIFLARLRAGEQNACEEFVREYTGRLLAVARRMLRSEDDAADAVQDAFVAAFTSLAQFRGQSQLSTWLHRIVVNACLMKLRAQKRRDTVSLSTLLPRFDDAGRHCQPVSPWGSQNLEHIERSEIRHTVRACIDQLPEDYRAILILRDIKELDTTDTAALLGVSRAAVKTRLHRARQALRTLLEPVLNSGSQECHSSRVCNQEPCSASNAVAALKQ